eukprot:6210534-Pleurochrysis_carterae.AAC.2
MAYSPNRSVHAATLKASASVRNKRLFLPGVVTLAAECAALSLPVRRPVLEQLDPLAALQTA